MQSELNGEILWLTHYTLSGKKYYVTSDYHRESYHLWKEDKDKITKTKYESSNPLELYKYCKE